MLKESGSSDAVRQPGTQPSQAMFELAYGELRRLAAHQLSRESAHHTWQATDLVHEAYLRLNHPTHQPLSQQRGYFFAAAAVAMRRILVEHARSKRSLKRGGDHAGIPLMTDPVSEPAINVELLDLDEAISALGAARPELAELVTLRYFGGLTMDEIAEAQGIPLRTVERNWTYAKAWLLRRLWDLRAAG